MCLADVVFSMLEDAAVTRAVLLDGGVLDAMAPGSIHVNMATVSVAFSREMAALHMARGVDAALCKHAARRGR